MSQEIPLQMSLFSDALVDTRTRTQKKQAQALAQPQQSEMFSQRELAQFGVQANPRLQLSPKTRLELLMEDPRTEEEKARQIQQEIEDNTYPMPWADRQA